jgi:xanthine/CO dehydrogenase XdhC/CoxF family maturation factor
MFELNKILFFGKAKLQLSQNLVLATIIRTEGSTYRKTGTQMIIAEDLSFEGAISGGCVENEVVRQAQSLFNGGPNLTFEYDGRYKLGCNGKLFLLLEMIDEDNFKKLVDLAAQYELNRNPFHLGILLNPGGGDSTYFRFGDQILSLGNSVAQNDPLTDAEEILVEPQNQVILIGSEYDAIQLAKFSGQCGFRTYLVGKDIRVAEKDFTVVNTEPEELTKQLPIDTNTAVVLMTHSFSRDLHFLKQLAGKSPGYLGILGPADRRDKLLSDLIELGGFDILSIPDTIYAPIGLDIGATLPEEISIAILSEIISVFRNGNVQHLKDRLGSIHLENN